MFAEAETTRRSRAAATLLERCLAHPTDSGGGVGSQHYAVALTIAACR